MNTTHGRMILVCILAMTGLPALAQTFSGETDVAGDTQPAIDSPLASASRLLTSGQALAARNIVEGMLRDDPDNIDALLLLGTIHIYLNDYQKAVELFDRIMVTFPENVMLLNNYSWLLSTATDPAYRNPAKALELAQKAILYEPGNFRVWSTLAEAHYVNGNFNRALDILRKGIEQAILNKAPMPVIESYRDQLRRLQDADGVMRLVE